MKHHLMHTLARLALWVLMIVPATAGAQEQASMQEPTPEQMLQMMARWLATTQPTEHHKHLDYFVGDWDTTMKTGNLVYPGMPPAGSS